MGERAEIRHGWVVVLLIAAGLLAARMAYLAWVCPYTLAEDEAHYWDWSRSLDWSYYSKGPGVAWLIRVMTGIFGQSELGVRAGAAVCASVATIGVTGIARAAFNDRRAMVISAVLFNLVPFYQVSALLMTIDMPYVACWSLAAWAAVVAIHDRGRKAWLALGAAFAAGFLFKYTMVMLVPGIVGAMAGRGQEARRHEGTEAQRHEEGGRGGVGRWVVAGVLVAIMGLLPVVIWNAERDWPTVRHLLGHVGVAGGDVPTAREPWTPLWCLEFVGTQIGLVGPALLLMFKGLARGRATEVEKRARTLVWMGLPLLVFYVALSLVNDAEGNWAIAAYVTLVPLAASVVAGLREHLHQARYPAWRWAWAFGVVVAVSFARLDLLARLPGLGAFIPVGRLMDADVRAMAVAREAARLEDETGLAPFVIAQHYGRASQLAFYLPDRPRVYCSSSLLGGRKTQFDMWPSTNLRLRDVNLELTGRPAVMLGGVAGQWEAAFELVEPLGAIDGETKKGRISFVGYGYRGFTGPGGR